MSCPALSLRPRGSNPFRPASPSQASANKNGDRRLYAGPQKERRTAGAVPLAMSLGRFESSPNLVADARLLLLVREEFGQRSGFTLLLCRH